MNRLLFFLTIINCFLACPQKELSFRKRGLWCDYDEVIDALLLKGHGTVTYMCISASLVKRCCSLDTPCLHKCCEIVDEYLKLYKVTWLSQRQFYMGTAIEESRVVWIATSPVYDEEVNAYSCCKHIQNKYNQSLMECYGYHRTPYFVC